MSIEFTDIPHDRAGGYGEIRHLRDRLNGRDPAVTSLDRDLENAQAELADLLDPPDGTALSPTLRILFLQECLRGPADELLTEIADRLSLRSFCRLNGEERLPSHEALAVLRSRLQQDAAASDIYRRLVERGASILRRPRRPLISIVSPVYRAEDLVEELVDRIREEVGALTDDFEIVLVDDGSPDRSWDRIERCCRADRRVRGVKLSRNFGQHPAITAGLAESRGEWVVVMDCDLQDNPRYIRELLREAREGYDVVFTVKERRRHGPIKNLFAHLFFRLSNWLSSSDQGDPRIGSFSIISRRVVEAFLQLQDVHRHYLILLRWLGFRSSTIRVRHEPRKSGRTSYSFFGLLRHAINGIVSHSDRILYLSIGVAFTVFAVSMLGIFYLVAAYLLLGFREGWTSIVVLILLTTSMIIFFVGTAGIYIGKTFEQVKNRPIYLVEETRNLSKPRVR